MIILRRKISLCNETLAIQFERQKMQFFGTATKFFVALWIKQDCYNWYNLDELELTALNSEAIIESQDYRLGWSCLDLFEKVST